MILGEYIVAIFEMHRYLRIYIVRKEVREQVSGFDY